MGRKLRGTMKRPMKITKKSLKQQMREYDSKYKTKEEKMKNTVLVPKVIVNNDNTDNIKKFKENAPKLYQQEQQLLKQLQEKQNEQPDFSQLFKGEQNNQNKQLKQDNYDNLQSYNPDQKQFEYQQQLEALKITQQDLKTSRTAMRIGRQSTEQQQMEQLVNFYKQLLGIEVEQKEDKELKLFQQTKEQIQQEIDQYEQNLQQLQQDIKQSSLIQYINDQIKECQQLLQINEQNNKTINKLMKGDKIEYNKQYYHAIIELNQEIQNLIKIRTIIQNKFNEKQLEQSQKLIQDSNIIPQVNTQEELTGSLRKVVPISQLQQTTKIINKQEQQILDKQNSHILKVKKVVKPIQKD